MADAKPWRLSPARLARRFFAGLPDHARSSLAIRIASVGLEFLALLVLARLLDPHGYGTYVLAMTLVAVFAVPAAVGLDRVVVRELAAYQALGDWEHAQGLLRHGVRVVLAASAVAAAATWASGRVVVAPGDPDAARALLVAAALVPLLALARLRQAMLQGLGHVTAGLVPEYLLQPGVVILLAVATAASQAIAPSGALAVGYQFIAAIAALTLGLAFLRRRIPRELRGAEPRYRAGAWWGAGVAFMGLVLMTTVLTSTDTLLMGRLVGPAEAGTYKVAAQLAMLVGLPLTAISVAMSPVIAGLYASGRIDELRLRNRAAARVITVAAAAVALGVAVLGPWILAAFGPGFESGYAPALVLSAAYLVHSAMATSGYLLIMSAHERIVMGVFAAGAGLNIAGALVLIPRFGALGAAASSALSLSLVSVSCALLARRKLGIDGTVFARPPSRATPA